MPLVISGEKTYEELAKLLQEKFELIGLNNDDTQPNAFLSELNEAIFADINDAEDLLARFQYWLAVLTWLQEQGKDLLVAAVYRNLEQILAVTALQRYLPKENQGLIDSLSDRYPSCERTTQFRMEEDEDEGEEPREMDFTVPEFQPYGACQRQLEQLKAKELGGLAKQAQSNRRMDASKSSARSTADNDYFIGSYESQASFRSSPSLPPSSPTPAKSNTDRAGVAVARASDSLQQYHVRLEKTAVENALNAKRQKFQVECFKGIYTAMRVERFHLGNFLNNLRSKDSVAEQWDIITSHVGNMLFLSKVGLSVLAWDKVRKVQAPSEADMEAKVTAYLVIHDALRKYQGGFSDFAAKLTGLSTTAQWAAIEHHASAKPNSRTAEAWRLAAKAVAKNLSFDKTFNVASGKNLLNSSSTRAWLLEQLKPTTPAKSHDKTVLSMGNTKAYQPLICTKWLSRNGSSNSIISTC